MVKLSPCPKCGDTEGIILREHKGYWLSCCVDAPVRRTEAEAEIAWNEMVEEATRTYTEL